jgi:hypothetical protein
MRFFSLVLTSLVTYISVAQNWTGNVNSDWNNPSNWSTWPLNNEDITINPAFFSGVAASPIISSNSAFSPAAITILNGGDLTISANLTTQDDVEVIDVGSSITVTAGTFSVNTTDGGRLIIDLQSSMLIQGGTVQVGERFIAGQDALITINGGTATSGERLLMDLGGKIIQNAGNVSTAAVFAMADGSPTQPSSYELNGGTLTITGEMAFENEFGIYEPTFQQNGGTLLLNGDMFWFGMLPGGGRPRFVQSNGIATINGNIENMMGSTVDLFIELKNTAVFNMNGSGFTLLHATDSIVKSGSAILNLNNTLTYTNPGVLAATGGNTNINGTITLAANGLFQFHNLTIQTTGTLNQLIPLAIKIGGNFQKNGSFNVGTNNVVLNGIQPQIVNGNGLLNLHHFTLEHTSTVGIDLQLETLVTGLFTLNSGKLTTTNVHPFRLADNATATVGNAISFVNGPMIKLGNDPFIFPVGRNNRWRRIGMTAPQNANAVVKASYFDGSYAAISPVNGPLTTVSNLEYWNLEEIVDAGSVKVDLYWEDAALSAIANCSDVTAARWNGNTWEHVLSTVTGNCTANNAGSLSSVANLTETGVLTFGFTSGVTTQNISICSGSSVTVGTNTYSSTGVYLDVFQDINQVDSIVITNLTVSQPVSVIQVLGQSLTSADINQDTYQWITCPSNQPILNETQAIFSPTYSGTFALFTTLNGCEAISNCIDVTIIDSSICQGQNVQIADTSFSVAGNYAVSLIGSLSQDSLVFLSLMVTTIDPTVNLTGQTLSAVETGADNYQWLDCANGYQPISGETAAQFIATMNGSYALEITVSGCSEVTECVAIAGLGFDEEIIDYFSIYPNPSNGLLNITLTGKEDYVLMLSTLQGELLVQHNFKPGKHLMDVHQLKAGCYFVHVYDGKTTRLQKVIVLE